MIEKTTKTIVIESCTGCPHVKKERTFKGNYTFLCIHPKKMRTISWPGTGYPDEQRGTVISEECERPSEYPKGIPKWCPLP